MLAVVVKGPDTPEMRQNMRDQLLLLKKRYGKTITEWDGDYDKIGKVKKDIRKFKAELEAQ